MTLGEPLACGAWRRDEDPCDAPAGFRTSHPGFGKCWEHYGDTPKGCAHAAQLEAIVKAEHVASLMGFPVVLETPDMPKELRGLARVYTALVTDVRIFEGAMAYCQARLFAGGGESHWIQARAALSEKWLKARRRADRAGVDIRDGREITTEALELHLLELRGDVS